MRFRAEPHTEFVRSVREVLKLQRREIPISVLVSHPFRGRGFRDRIDGSLRGLLLDVNTCAREDLMAAMVACGEYRKGGTPETVYHHLKRETEGKVAVWRFAWVPKAVSDFDRDFALARKLGCRQILFWEADYIDGRPNKEELQKLMHSRAMTPPEQ